MRRRDYFLNGMAFWKPSLYMATKEKEKWMIRWEVNGVVVAALLGSVPFWLVIYYFFGV